MAAHSMKLQVSGYRFLLRRIEYALLRGDTRMVDDPIRGQALSLAAGVTLAAIAVAVSLVLALLRPQGTLGSAPIVVVRDSGALYVRIGDVVHPVFNLASARLIAGTPANPETVSSTAISNSKRGPLVGIPGAPAEVWPALGPLESGWAICDDKSSTTVVAGALPADPSSSAVLVTPRSETAAITYLLYDGWRAEVDLRNHAVVRAMQLDGITPRPVSRALLDATPEAPPIAPPRIPGLGAPSPLRGLPVGSVVRVVRAAADEYYVVLANGVQRIGQVAADLIRFADSQDDRTITTVAPDSISAMPILDTLALAALPARGGVSENAMVCVRWQLGSAGANTTVVLVNSPSDTVMALAQADGDGPCIDAFAMPRGRSAYVRSVGVRSDGMSSGALYLVDNSGVVFGLRDEDTAKQLGLTGAPVAAPWPVLSWLPRGPELSRDAASVVRDSVAGPP